MLTKIPIARLAKVGAGQGAPKQESDFSESGHPFIRAGHLEDLINGLPENELPKVDELTAKKYRLKLYPQGTIVFAKSGMSATKGRIYALKSECYIVNHLATLELKESAHSPYIQFALREYSPTKLVKDKAYPSISKTEIEAFKIPLPNTKNDQILIAEVLSKVERLISQRKESINLLDELLKSTFLEMFGDPKINPSNYPIRHLSEFYITPKQGVKCGPFGSALKKDEYTKEGIPVWVMDNISKDGKFSPDGCLWVSEEKYEDLRSYGSQDGDVLISRAGTVGKMSVLQSSFERSIISTNLIRLRLSKELSPQYFVCLMNYCKGRVGRLKTGPDGAFTHMSTKVLDSLFFPYPSIEKQLQFLDVYNRAQLVLQDLEQSLRELGNLAASLSQLAFKGELDLRKLEIDHIIPVSQGGADDEENLQVVSTKENRRISDKPKTTRIGNAIMENYNEEDIADLLKEHFGSFDFRFSEIIEFFENEKAVALNYLTSEELKRQRNLLEQDIKTFIFSCVEGKNPYLKLGQKFVNAFEDSELKSLNPRVGRDSILAELNSSPATLELEDISGIYFKIMK